MDEPLETAAFLSTSSNRVRVLELLAADEHTREDLREAVDVSRVTLSRILTELEERHWVARRNRTYRLTSLGRLVLEEFQDLLDALAAERQLRSVVHQLPRADLPFDLRRLADGEVVRPSRGNPIAHVNRLAADLAAADRVRVLAFSIVLPALEAARSATVDGDQRFEAVLTPDVYDVILEDEKMRPPFHEMRGVENATYYVRDAELPGLFVVDGTVALLLTDAELTSRGLLITDDEVVRSWAVDLFETHREAGEWFAPDRFGS